MLAVVSEQVPLLYRCLSFSGIFVFIAIAWLFSYNRKDINWKTVGWGVGLQFIFGVIVLHPEMQKFFFTAVNGGVNQLLSFSEEAATFVFGSMDAHVVNNIDLASGEVTENVVVGQVLPV